MATATAKKSKPTTSKPTTSKKEYSSLRFGEYNGNPLIVLGPEDARFPFQFGKAKAGLLLAAMDEVGDAEFRELLENFCAN